VNIPRLLYQLQEADNAADACREQISHIDTELKSDPLAAERVVIEKQHIELKRLQHELREATGQIDDYTDRIKNYEERLYSGRITNPKELSTLQKDIELLKGHRAPFEDKALELMESIDAVEAEINKAEALLQRHKEALEVRRKELGEELKRLGAELAEHETRRAALLPDIPTDVVEQYRLLRKQKGRAVARVEQASCRGCGIAVTAAFIHRARAGEIVHCGSCNRILYLE